MDSLSLFHSVRSHTLSLFIKKIYTKKIMQALTSNIGVTSYRWVILVVFCIVNCTNAIMWITFSPINSKTQVYYLVDSTKVNALSVCYLALYAPGFILAVWLFNTFSLRKGFFIGAAINMLAGWIRFISVYGDRPSLGAYACLIIGQILGGLAQPIFMNIPSKLASRWFPTGQRDIATVLALMSNLIGVAIGTIVPSEFVLDPPSEYQNGFSNLLLFEALFATGALILVFFLFRDRPQLPPSLSEQAKKNSDEKVSQGLGFSQCLQCFQSRNFIFLIFAFGIGLGIFNSLTTVIEQITRPSCATSSDASLFGGLTLGIGILSAIAVGLAMDRFHRYRLALRICFAGGLAFVVGLTLAIRPGNIDAIAAMFALLGLFMMPALPLSFQAASECTYPVPEDVSCGLLMLSGQWTGIGFIFGLDALIPQVVCATEFTYPGSSVLLVVATACALLAILPFQEDNKRLRVDLSPLSN